MDISVDKEIPEEDICTGLRRLKAKDIFLDLEVECPDREENIDVNIYGISCETRRLGGLLMSIELVGFENLTKCIYKRNNDF